MLRCHWVKKGRRMGLAAVVEARQQAQQQPRRRLWQQQLQRHRGIGQHL